MIDLTNKIVAALSVEELEKVVGYLRQEIARREVCLAAESHDTWRVAGPNCCVYYLVRNGVPFWIDGQTVWYGTRYEAQIAADRMNHGEDPKQAQKRYGPWYVIGLPDGLFCVWRTATTGDGIAYTLPSGKRAVYSMPASAQEIADRLNRAGGGAHV